MLTKEIYYKPSYVIKKENFLFILFSSILFSVVFITGSSWFYNPIYINFIELLFILFYIITLRELPPFINLFKNNRIISSVLLMWIISITFSFISSPLNLTQELFANARYFQTISHLFAFIFIFDYFNRYKKNIDIFLLIIPFTTLIILILFFIIINFIDSNNLERFFFLSPPFNSHIRHTGFQASAALSILLVMNIKKKSPFILNFTIISSTIAVSTFIVWIGGRSSFISISATAIFILLILRFKGIKPLYFLTSILIISLLSIIIAETLSVYQWNGLFNQIHRSIESATVNSFSTGRLEIWKTCWENIKSNPLFGLGPQGYFFMSNRIYSVHPHNVFFQFLIEWGIVGTILFIFLLGKAFSSGIKLHLRNKSEGLSRQALMSLAMITTLTVHSLTAGTYYHPQSTFYLVVAFAVWITPAYETEIK